MESGYQSTSFENMLYSCSSTLQRATEQFIEVHALAHVLSGELHFTTIKGTKILKAGSLGLIKRNQLVKATKVPPPGAEFKSINIFFNQEILRSYRSEHHLQSSGQMEGEIFEIRVDSFMNGFFQSLQPYFEKPERMTTLLTELKTKEAIELILTSRPPLLEVLFDFSEPYKIDLEAFMQKHFKFNISIDVLARLTGRSRAGFKRDFEKIFHTSPGQWLKQKRLQEAFYLIKVKGIKPSVAYLEVGFENLSHFSYAFKKQFGINPSVVNCK
jgi:AraC-like DNA-binding protein